MAQRLVAWNELGSRFMPETHGEAVSMSLDYASLVHEQPKLAEALGRGRIVSHNVLHYGYGVLFTFVVED